MPTGLEFIPLGHFINLDKSHLEQSLSIYLFFSPSSNKITRMSNKITGEMGHSLTVSVMSDLRGDTLSKLLPSTNNRKPLKGPQQTDDHKKM